MSGKHCFHALKNTLFSLEAETIIVLSISSSSQLDLQCCSWLLSIKGQHSGMCVFLNCRADIDFLNGDSYGLFNSLTMLPICFIFSFKNWSPLNSSYFSSYLWPKTHWDMTKGFVLFLKLQLSRMYLICWGWFVILMGNNKQHFAAYYA